MVARPAPMLPRGPFAYEPKLDGARCIARVESGRARLQSRQQRPLTRYFPEVVAALGEHFADVAFDGELVVCGSDGRLDFPTLTQRIAGSRRDPLGPAGYVVFDVLAAGGTDLRGHPYRVRRAVLQQLLDGIRPPLALVPMTMDGNAAQVWLTEHLTAGVEGVVAKRLDHAYAPGTRAWSKIRGYTSVEAVVGGVLGPLRAPVALVLGRRDEHGQLRVVGRTSAIPRGVRGDVGALLRPLGAWHPWPVVLPPSRFGDAGAVEYSRVEPEVVVELAVDAAVDVVRGRPVWRHPARFVRVRADLRAMDVPPVRC
jgi:ATP-dependent DNA ligase